MLRLSGSDFRSKGCRCPDLQSEFMRKRALSPLRRLGQVPSYSPHCFVSQSTMLWEKSVQSVVLRAKYKTYRPLDDHWVIFSTSKAISYSRARRDEIRCSFDPPKFVE